MEVNFQNEFEDLKDFINRKFDDERKRVVKIIDYEFPAHTFKMPDIEAYLNIDRKTVVRAIEKGKLKAFKVGDEGRDWRTTREELDKYLSLLFQESEKRMAG
jgi:excisionase family DNA binding protein